MSTGLIGGGSGVSAIGLGNNPCPIVVDWAPLLARLVSSSISIQRSWVMAWIGATTSGITWSGGMLSGGLAFIAFPKVSKLLLEKDVFDEVSILDVDKNVIEG